MLDHKVINKKYVKFSILIPILIYYGLLAVLFLLSAFNVDSPFNDYNSQDVTDIYADMDTSKPTGIVDYLLLIPRFALFAILGVGLPADTPLFIQIPFSIWSLSVFFISIAMFYQALRGS